MWPVREKFQETTKFDRPHTKQAPPSSEPPSIRWGGNSEISLQPMWKGEGNWKPVEEPHEVAHQLFPVSHLWDNSQEHKKSRPPRKITLLRNLTRNVLLLIFVKFLIHSFILVLPCNISSLQKQMENVILPIFVKFPIHSSILTFPCNIFLGKG